MRLKVTSKFEEVVTQTNKQRWNCCKSMGAWDVKQQQGLSFRAPNSLLADWSTLTLAVSRDFWDFMATLGGCT